MQRIDYTRLDALVKEFHICRTFCERPVEQVFDEFLSNIHIVFEVEESHFRLAHPEFRKMARCVRIFCAECQPERVDASERSCKCLCFELTRNSKACFFAEKVAAVVHNLCCVLNFLAALSGLYAKLCNLFERESCDLEHFACAFSIAASDFRSINIVETALLKERVKCECHLASHPVHGAECVRARAQVSVVAQILHRHFVFLERICFWVALTEHSECFKRDFNRLSACRRLNEFSCGLDACACCNIVKRFFHSVFICGCIFAVVCDLNGSKARTVVYLNEYEVFRIAHSAHPAADCNGTSVRG